MIEEKPLPWQELIEVLFRRQRLIVGLGLVGLLASAAIALTTPDLYRASARVRLSAEALAGPRAEAMGRQQIQTEISYLEAPDLTHQVLQDYRRTQRPDEPNYAPKHRAKKLVMRVLGGFIDFGEDEEEDEIPGLLGNLRVNQQGGTNLIEVSYTTYDAQWAARFVNDLLTIHVERIAEESENQRRALLNQDRANEAFSQWKEAQEVLAGFREEYGATLLSGDENHLRRVLSDLEASRVATETRVLELAAKVDFLTREISLHPDTIAAESKVTESDAVRQLNSRILELEMERSELLSRYTPTSIRVQDIERRIEEARRLLSTKERETLSEIKTVLNPAYQALEIELVETRGQLSASEAKVEALSTQIADYRNRLNRLENTAAELERYQEDVEIARKAYQGSRDREEEARRSSSLAESGMVNISIVGEAVPPKEPQPSKRTLILVGGLLGGLVLGIVLGFLRDWVDPTIKGSAQAYRLSRIPVIAEIPSR